VPFADTYAGRRVLVTGHTGFKGSWLLLLLRKLGAELCGYALPPDTNPNLFDSTGLADLVQHHQGDVRELQPLLAAMQDFAPEVVFHLAAQPLVRRSYQQPKETFDTNVGGTVNLLEAVRQTPSVRAVVVITTDKVYENREWLWGYREIDPLGGHDPYSASKAAAELVVSAYQRSFAEDHHGKTIGIASARAGNVIGGGDWAEDRIIPDAVRAVRNGEKLHIRNPQSVRPWQHVLEPLAAYLALGQRLLQQPNAFAGAWNFAPLPHDNATVIELVQRFYQLLGRGDLDSVPSEEPNAPHEAGLLRLNCDKAHSQLDWQPIYDVHGALRETAAWYRRVELEGGNPYDACVEDIDSYLQAAAAAGAWWA